MSDPKVIELCLVSHTNSGKTTLARTLLNRNVGEIRDEAHVTTQNEPYTMIDTAEGDVLRLWDTPGFGDSVRLARRLAQQGNPVGWFLTQVWDRWRDRPFWSSQQAMNNVREHADVVLYLVNAAEDPVNAGYVTPEMQILQWIGKPVFVLLNHVGAPRSRSAEAQEEDAWRAHLASFGFAHRPLSLDAFARCWVQEFVLLRAIGEVVPEDKQASFGRLEAAWRGRRLQQFHASIAVLAEQLARAACVTDERAAPQSKSLLRVIANAITRKGDEDDGERAQAMQRLAARLDVDIRAATDQLIDINGLEGRAAVEVLSRLAQDFSVQEPVDEGKAAVWGGVVSGALSGLAADLAAGGITFGAGLLVGGVLGALGGAGAAKGYNRLTNTQGLTVRWSDEFMHGLVRAALLRYLAIAHYGRGRGEWSEGEYPPHWKTEVDAVLTANRATFDAIWHTRDDDCAVERLRTAIDAPLRDAALVLLNRLYPDALGDIAGDAAGSSSVTLT